jgi:hypothetical protein
MVTFSKIGILFIYLICIGTAILYFIIYVACHMFGLLTFIAVSALCNLAGGALLFFSANTISPPIKIWLSHL